MFLLVVVGEELVDNLLMADSADGSEEFVHIQGLKLRLEEFRTKNILVAEGTGTDVQRGVTAHVRQAGLP